MEKLKIFNHAWHIAHQYSLMKALDGIAEFYWLRQYKRPFSDKPRGDLPVTIVDHYEPGVYDLALLHVDQQCFEPNIMARGKGRLYQELNEAIKDIPKLVIMHGTPYYPEVFPTSRADGLSDQLISLARQLIGDNTLIVNSRTAAKQWGFGTPIIHGLDPADWWDLPKERRVVTMISPGGLDMYYDRAFLQAVREFLMDECEIQLCQISVDWTAQSFDYYRNFLGRSLVYFNPTRESPMPRARTEAMLSGCCVVTTPHQDASDFIEDGVNGFLIRRNPAETAELIVKLLKNHGQAMEVGQKGKETAKRIFSVERYRQEWIDLLSKVLNRAII